jgi:hypothetical protein
LPRSENFAVVPRDADKPLFLPEFLDWLRGLPA